MKPKLILMSHGNLAHEIYEAAQTITGEADGIYVICMSMDDGLDGTRAKLDNILESLPLDSGILIIADISGGTPCNVAMERLNQYDGIRVITGLNLSMVVEYALSSDEGLDELCESVHDSGIGAVKIIAKPKGEMADGGYED